MLYAIFKPEERIIIEFMREALKEAERALVLKEVPVGAVIVKDNNIIARAHNLKETMADPTAHAEVLAIREACKDIGNWRLTGCDMYVTLEPCAMCASAIAQARISNLYIGTFDPMAGACGSVLNVVKSLVVVRLTSASCEKPLAERYVLR